MSPKAASEAPAKVADWLTALPPEGATAYLAPEGLVGLVQRELTGVVAVLDRLVIAAGPPQRCFWAANIWYDPRLYPAPSIGAAAAVLRGLQRSWWPYAWHLHRRHALLQEKLPHVSAKPLAFPAPVKVQALGSYALLQNDLLLAAPHCSSPFPNGEAAFLHDSEGPPSRAYLKIMEALTRIGVRPQAGELCLDLGASPGGWTWVLAGLGAHVRAYDRADLAPQVAAMPGVTAVRGDAFAAKPAVVGAVDWLFSDVICYPERLLEHVQLWLASGLCRNFVCTLKFQGDAHYGVIADFAAIPGSQIMHLHHNKHELTWVLVR